MGSKPPAMLGWAGKKKGRRRCEKKKKREKSPIRPLGKNSGKGMCLFKEELTTV
jgi:hypothetical protein